MHLVSSFSSLATVFEIPQQPLKSLLEPVVILPIAEVADVARAAQARGPGVILQLPSWLRRGQGGGYSIAQANREEHELAGLALLFSAGQGIARKA